MQHTTRQRSIPDPFLQLLGFDPFHTPQRSTAQGAEVFAPRFDVQETGAAYLVVADLPGVQRQEVEIELHHGVLTIRGGREPAALDRADMRHLSERCHGSFERSIRFPDKADPDDVSATLEAGVLRVRVAKIPEAMPRKIVLTTREPQAA